MDKVKLISAEGEVFLVERRVACVSGTISNMLEGARGRGVRVASWCRPARGDAGGQVVLRRRSPCSTSLPPSRRVRGG